MKSVCFHELEDVSQRLF